MREVLKKVQINMPFRMLVDEYLDILLEERIQPEIGVDCFALDRFSRSEFHDVADRLHGAGLSITLHAPFFDLRPGAIDRKVREVCHAAFDEKYYVSHEDVWLENSRDTWSSFIETAAGMGTKIALENVYEGSPKHLGLLLDTFQGSQNIGLCFDTGHFNAFSRSTLEEWLDALGSRIVQIHLHDNDGSADEHKPVGDGTFPFHRFFELLGKKGVRPIVTLEPHTVEDLWRSLENIGRMGLLDYLGE